MNNPKVSEEGIATMKREFDMPCRESQIAALHAEIATLRAEATKAAEELTHTRETMTRVIAATISRAATAEAALARERELARDLRQVVKTYRSFHDVCKFLDADDFRCSTCERADVLLELSEPADTREKVS